MNGLEIWHCGGWVKRYSGCGELAAVCAWMKVLDGDMPSMALHKRRSRGRVLFLNPCSEFNIFPRSGPLLYLFLPLLYLPSKKVWYGADSSEKTETQTDNRSRTSRLYTTPAEARQGLSGADSA
jgi:hypothetical protein